jgi:hypothetical protein
LGRGKHFRTSFFVKVHPNFGVTTSGEAVPLGDELPAKLVMVVQLPFECDPDISTLVAEGLSSVCDIDDGQAPHCQRGTWSNEDLLIVWSAMGK